MSSSSAVAAAAASRSTPRTRTGCQSCRVRHLKCDEGRPSCSRCARSAIECIRGYNIRFRHGANPSVKLKGASKCEYDFDHGQTWMKTSTTLNFVDETKELISIYERDDADTTTSSNSVTTTTFPRRESSPLLLDNLVQPSSVGSMPPPQDDWVTSTPLDWSGCLSAAIPLQRQTTASDLQNLPPPRPGLSVATTAGTARSPDDKRDSPFSFGHGYPQHHQSADPTALEFPLPETPELTRIHSVSSQQVFPQRSPSLHGVDLDNVSPLSTSFSRVYSEIPLWPLSDVQEARLMRYFIEKLAESFDLCDPSRHFAQTVPQRAAICPILLNAVMAVSARHLSRISNFDPLVSDQYHQKCLKHLIPILSDKAAITDENLLAATVILRFLEEVEIPISGVEWANHLLGTHVFITAQEASTNDGGLRQAAYLVALRQEIYVAFVNQRTIASVFERSTTDRSVDTASDWVWANRVVVHLADVIRFCFGEYNNDRGVSTYQALVEYCHQWMLFKPISFTPLYYKSAEPMAGKSSSVFPEIWLTGDHIVTALQHYHLALILLAAHDPKIPRLGPNQRIAQQAMDRDIKSSVLAVCGMAISNPATAPNWVSACMAVVICGDRFTQRLEQEALLNILDFTEKEHAWPTGTAVLTLKEAWGWLDTQMQT